MRSSLRHYMAEAVVSYEEKPREQWLFDYPAQVSLCGTQIWWTTEVNIAFGRLEEVKPFSFHIAHMFFCASYRTAQCRPLFFVNTNIEFLFVFWLFFDTNETKTHFAKKIT